MVFKGRETKKDTLDLLFSINKVSINAKEGDIIIRNLPIKSKINLSFYSLKRLSN